MPLASIVKTSGIIVATKGMLSKIADRSAEIHRIISMVKINLPAVAPMIMLASSVITPVASKAPTTTKSPIKKSSVGHST
ncbi:hypothetical protein DSECCO2_659180 [anaerobic digester metagenome]